MKNLFDSNNYQEVMYRLNQLTAQSARQWGKMDVAQMLAHCKEAFKVPLSPQSPPRMLIGILIGWMMKAKLYNDAPWGKNLPTAPNFIIKDERVFEQEKQALVNLVTRFYQADPADIEKIVHPMFGSFTGQQWGMAMYKHLDHHLRQFGV
jgi:hypothetical protein